ncbi:hypothetical protein cypCar_00039153 [Cyprinus carpio]|nr:hypothetical protein cypCar_00039153 [Cyprinus carpio]
MRRVAGVMRNHEFARAAAKRSMMSDTSSGVPVCIEWQSNEALSLGCAVSVSLRVRPADPPRFQDSCAPSSLF